MGNKNYIFEKKIDLLRQVFCVLLICLCFVATIHQEAQAASGAFEFETENYTVHEGTGKVDIIIKRIGGSDGTATVDWRTKKKSATWGSDYGDFDWTTLTFAEGETSKTETITIVDDSREEGDETFNVLLSNPTGGATLGSLTTAAVTIKDGLKPLPAGAFAFDMAGYSVDEGGGTVSITISRLGGSNGVATVDWKTNSGTATWRKDYGDFDWTTLTFAEGEISKTETIAIVDDSLEEGDEIFNVLLSNPTGGATLDTITTATVTIADNDSKTAPIPAPTEPSNPGSFAFDMAGFTVNEGAGTASVTISRLGGSNGVATVDWKTKSGTATWRKDYGDFDWTTLTFADGETSKTETIAIVDDSLEEGNETFNVLLSNPTGGSTLDTITTATVTITDNDLAAPVQTPGSFEFELSSYPVKEGDGNVSITIKRVNGSDGIATVDWRTKGKSATFGKDYGDFDWTTLTFADGETSKTETIAIVDDTLQEDDETFDVSLGNPTGGAALGAITTTAVSIRDNDMPPATPGSFEFAVGSYSVDEDETTVNITIKRVGGTSGIATVDWRTKGKTATFGEDYGDFDWTTLTFADGEASKTKTISIVDDTKSENNETFDVLLGNASGGATLGALASTTVTIVDNDESGNDPATSEPDPNLGYLPIFPGAQGFGTETKAGRGGKVIKVTNLNDSGSGSLRAAIAASGPRIIVFEVSGNINLTSNLTIKNPYITIAGQTAPSPGVTLKGAGLAIKTHDVLIQHLRVRIGDGSTGPAPLDRDGLAIYGPNGYNVVLDHMSVSWAIDKGTSSWNDGVKNVTLSNSIVSEGLYNSINPQGAHSMGSLVGDYTKNYAYVGNLWAHNWTRNPAMKGGTSTVVLNNLMYDAGPWTFMYMADDFDRGAHISSIVGNVLIEGPSSDTTQGLILQGDVKSSSKIYLSDNSYRGGGSFFKNQSGSDPRVSSPPVWHPSLKVLSSSSVEASVLDKAGARPDDRDAVDNRIVNEVKNRGGNIIDSQSQVGGWPNLAKNTRTFNVPSNPNGDDDGDGYTNIEEILHQMAAAVEGR